MADAKAAHIRARAASRTWDVSSSEVDLRTGHSHRGDGQAVGPRLERARFPPKVCGEGVLPPGVRALEHWECSRISTGDGPTRFSEFVHSGRPILD